MNRNPQDIVISEGHGPYDNFVRSNIMDGFNLLERDHKFAEEVLEREVEARKRSANAVTALTVVVSTYLSSLFF